MVRQAKRRAHKQGTLTLQSTTTADGASLAKFYAAECANCKGKNGTIIASDPALRRFHDEAAPAAEHFGYFRLYLLDLSGAKIAGLYNFEFNRRPFRNQEVGYDEAFRKLAPGPLLVNYVLQDCAVRGTFAKSIFSVRGWNGRPIGPIECAHIPSASCSKEHSLGLWRIM
jgi:Acetyltransferase (GNAT) domain